MSNASLIGMIDGQIRRVPLRQKGLILGRDPSCDVVLDSLLVSRRHARIYQDPFGRWILEDLHSFNGVSVNGRRVQAWALGPGDRILLRPFQLVFEEEPTAEVTSDPRVCALTRMEQDEGVRIAYSPDRTDVSLSRLRLQELTRLADSLAGVASVHDLYPHLCQLLATWANSMVAVVDLPDRSQPLPENPRLLACVFSRTQDEGLAPGTVRLSRRILEAVHRSRSPVIGTNAGLDGAGIGLTVVDEHNPRTVLCVPAAAPGDNVECIYVDLPAEEATADLVDFLQIVGRQVSQARRSLLLAEAKAQRQVLDHQISLAREIQARLVSSMPEKVTGVDVAVRYEPAMWVGGDYADLWPLPDGRLAFAVGDVAGKGLPAALVMSNLQAALRVATTYCTQPAEVMKRVNQHLYQSTPEAIFVTLFLGILDPLSGQVEYVDAGHGYAMLVPAGGEAIVLDQSMNTIVGAFDTVYQSQSVSIGQGAGLVVMTDGIIEAMSPNGERLGLQRVQKVLAEAAPTTAAQAIQAVMQAAEEFRGGLPAGDDVTMLALWRQG